MEINVYLTSTRKVYIMPKNSAWHEFCKAILAGIRVPCVVSVYDVKSEELVWEASHE